MLNLPIYLLGSSYYLRTRIFLATKGNSVRTIDNKISIVRAAYNFVKKQSHARQDNPAANRALMTKNSVFKVATPQRFCWRCSPAVALEK